MVFQQHPRRDCLAANWATGFLHIDTGCATPATVTSDLNWTVGMTEGGRQPFRKQRAAFGHRSHALRRSFESEAMGWCQPPHSCRIIEELHRYHFREMRCLKEG